MTSPILNKDVYIITCTKYTCNKNIVEQKQPPKANSRFAQKDPTQSGLARYGSQQYEIWQYIQHIWQ